VGCLDEAADRLVFADFFALDAEQLRLPSAFADGDEIVAGRLADGFGLDDGRLQHAVRCDAGGKRFDVGWGMRRLTRVARRFLEAVERNELVGIAGDVGLTFDMVALLRRTGVVRASKTPHDPWLRRERE
jgi:hypothetical protein